MTLFEKIGPAIADSCSFHLSLESPLFVGIPFPVTADIRDAFGNDASENVLPTDLLFHAVKDDEETLYVFNSVTALNITITASGNYLLSVSVNGVVSRLNDGPSLAAVLYPGLIVWCISELMKLTNELIGSIDLREAALSTDARAGEAFDITTGSIDGFGNSVTLPVVASVYRNGSSVSAQNTENVDDLYVTTFIVTSSGIYRLVIGKNTQHPFAFDNFIEVLVKPGMSFRDVDWSSMSHSVHFW